MNILITGSCGFIGYFVTLEFLKQNYTVLGVDNLNNFYTPTLKRYRLSKLQTFPNYIHLEIDISYKSQLEHLQDFVKKIIKNGIDLVVHLAAYPSVKYSLKHPQKYIKNNIIATQNLLEFIKNNNNINKKLIIASTSSVYSGNPLPYKEESYINHFLSPYAYTKFCSENIAKYFHLVHNFSIVVLRYFTVYGPYNRPDMAVYKFMWNTINQKPIVIRGKDISRDFTFVEDASKATFKAKDLLNHKIFEIINIGSDNPIKVVDLVNMIFEVLQKETKVIVGKYESYEPQITWADISKAKSLLSYNPSNNLKQNLYQTYMSLKEYWLSISKQSSKHHT
ncbi:MAG: NAD-dependent epimerase/dehydratase family protein [bacterium]